MVGEAERLVPQASSPEAANALLKVLEEPPPDTYFILTAAEPASLLPTIRSRLVQLRVHRLRVSEVARFLGEVPQPPLPPAEAKRRAELAGGSIGSALAEAGEHGSAETAGRALLEAAVRGPGARLRYALGVRSFGGRGEFTETLAAAADLLRNRLAERLRNPGAGRAGEPAATSVLEAIREIERARKLARGNVNPQLIVADVTRRLAERLA